MTEFYNPTYSTGAGGPPVAGSSKPRLNKKNRDHFASGAHTHDGNNSKLLSRTSVPFVAAKISKNGTQTILNITEAVILFSVTDFDSNNLADLPNEHLIIREKGYYCVKYQIGWENGTTATWRKAFLYLNGSIVARSLNTEPNTNFQGASVNSGSVDLDCNVNDVLELRGYHNNGSPLAVTNLNGGTWLSLTGIPHA